VIDDVTVADPVPVAVWGPVTEGLCEAVWLGVSPEVQEGVPVVEGVWDMVLDAVLLGVCDPVCDAVCSAVILPLTVAVLLGLCEGVTVPDPVGNCDPEPVCVNVGVPVVEGVPDPVPEPDPDTDPDPD
jgi:hypothetical protein